jgi:hypothetical protein
MIHDQCRVTLETYTLIQYNMTAMVKPFIENLPAELVALSLEYVADMNNL